MNGYCCTACYYCSGISSLQRIAAVLSREDCNPVSTASVASYTGKDCGNSAISPGAGRCACNATVCGWLGASEYRPFRFSQPASKKDKPANMTIRINQFLSQPIIMMSIAETVATCSPFISGIDVSLLHIAASIFSTK